VIPRYKRPNPKRKTPRAVHSERTAHLNGGHKRVRLYGAERMKRRDEIFARAGGRCEEMVVVATWGDPFIEAIFGPNTFRAVIRCPNRATQWSHAKHAARKCDCYSPTSIGACSIASCDGCHERRHAGGNGKPCPKK